MSEVDEIVQLDPPKLQEIVKWLRNNYEDISKLCEEKGLPKPPPW